MTQEYGAAASAAQQQLARIEAMRMAQSVNMTQAAWQEVQAMRAQQQGVLDSAFGGGTPDQLARRAQSPLEQAYRTQQAAMRDLRDHTVPLQRQVGEVYDPAAPALSHNVSWRWGSSDEKILKVPRYMIPVSVGWIFQMCPPHQWSLHAVSDYQYDSGSGLAVAPFELIFLDHVDGDVFENAMVLNKKLSELYDPSYGYSNRSESSETNKRKPQKRGRRLNLNHITSVGEELGDPLHGEG